MTEETQTPIEEPTRDEPTSGNVGDILSEAKSRAIKALAIFASILIYLAGILYAEAHGMNMLTKGINPDFLLWAYVGMVALGLTAVVLPLALHFWTFDHMQRMIAIGFYILDLGLLIFNAFSDYGMNTGAQLSSWEQMYITYIMPATPIIMAIGWTLIWQLDPSTKAHTLRQTLRTSIIQAKANQIATAAKASSVSQAVNAAAEREVEEALSELFGKPVKMTKKETNVPRVEVKTAPIPEEVKAMYAPGTRFIDGTSNPMPQEEPPAGDAPFPG
jgi:hypothetical protein